MSGKAFLALLGIIILAVFLRFWGLGSIPPGLYPDEAMNGNNAIEAIANGDFKVFYQDNNGREGLFINIQAFSIYLFGRESWALRGVSGVFGVLTVLGIFFLAREMFRSHQYRDRLALLAALFLATSFWHINFSRIGFRAITAPFFLVWGLYFFFRFYNDSGTAPSQIVSAALGGLIFGLGFHSYIAYRAAPILFLPLVISGWRRLRRETCFPCLVLIFLLFASFVFIPLGLYFYENPVDFLGRTSQISIFSEPSPVSAFLKNAAKTIGMFWIYGDPNWRHNFSGAPELSIIVELFFLIGIILAFRNLSKLDVGIEKFNSFFLLFWLALMLFPVMISSEGLPHALRGIIAIPPVMILSAFGLEKTIEYSKKWVKRSKEKYPAYASQLSRIEREFSMLFAVMIVAIAANAYDMYFNKWSPRPEVYASFNARDWGITQYLKSLPDEVEKYIIINEDRLDSRIVTISSQPVLFGTGTFLPDARERKKYHYVTNEALGDEFQKKLPESAVIVFLKEDDAKFAAALVKKYSRIRLSAPGDFIALIVSPL